MVDDYPNSQWREREREEEIKFNLSGFCKVLEVDPAYLDDHNFGPLHLLLEIYDERDIPSKVWITETQHQGRVGSMAKITLITV